MGSVSSPFFCKRFQLSKDYKDITNCFYVLYRIQIQIQMLHMTKSFYFTIFTLQTFFVWNCSETSRHVLVMCRLQNEQRNNLSCHSFSYIQRQLSTP